MGGDMTNLKNSNLKVPPLKIVLSSATSGGSDRSTSTSPSSDSESLDSNLTIISENQQERNNRSDHKDDAVQGRFDKVSRHNARGNGSGSYSGVDHTTSNVANVSVNKRTNHDINNDSNVDTTATTKEPTSSSNQRITRSSQRAAQQNRSDNCNETNGDDTNLADNQDNKSSSSEQGQRKVKRRKAEQVEALDESSQQVQQQPIVMANICPADYQLPSQNSFELYRDIRNRPYMKMMELVLPIPKVPHGFKDYIIYGGPYLLEGNKVGLGLSGGRIDSPDVPMKTIHAGSNCIVPKAKLSSNFRRRPSLNQSSFNQRHSSYIIPKLLEAPKNLKLGSPLFELFQDQEKSRQRMRMQHMKERERSVLTSEQEILRAYNQATIADNQQSLHLSACTYFYYQERYHYIDEKSNYLDSINQKDSSQSRENSDSCNAENVTTGRLQVKDDEQTNTDAANKTRHSNQTREVNPNANASSNSGSDPSKPSSKKRKGDQEGDEKVETIDNTKDVCDKDSSKVVKAKDELATEEQDSMGEKAIDNKSSEDKTLDKSRSVEEIPSGSKTFKTDARSGVVISESDLKDSNKATFLKNLQDIDNKWAKIKDEMFVRHKNESDSLYAVQCLEWEWKAKEVGACDVRLSLKVDPEFVPKVVVSALDY